jgi:hypothetical protein
MATHTATSFTTKTLTYAPAGLNAIYATIDLGSTTLATNDIILLAKLPRTCKVIDLIEDHTLPNTTGAFDFGIEAADLGANSAWGNSAIANALAKGQVNRADAVGRLPIQVNATASDRDYSILKAKYVSTTNTVSLVMRATVIVAPGDNNPIG